MEVKVEIIVTRDIVTEVNILSENCDNEKAGNSFKNKRVVSATSEFTLLSYKNMIYKHKHKQEN